MTQKLLRVFVATSIAAAGLLAQSGCSRKSEPAAADAKTAPAPQWKLDESALIQPIRFSPTDLDPAGNACTDLAGYVNDKWLAANSIPADQTAWGASDILRQRTLDVQRQIAEHAASLPAADGVQKIVADLWTTGMDEARVNAQGLEPLKSRLAAIDALDDGPAIADYLRKTAATGENPLLGLEALPDFKDSSVNIAYAEQGGLGLPDKTYYFDADKKPLREAYQAHIAKVLELSGVPTADAVRQAVKVMAFETQLARVSKSAEEMSRDVSLYYNPIAPDAADKLTPNFPWTAFFTAVGVDQPQRFSLSVPAFHEEVNAMLGGKVPVADWQSYLRFRLVDQASPYLSAAFVDEYFDFYGKTLQGQKEQKPRWKRVLGAVEDSAGEAMGQLYVDVAFPASSKARMEQLVDNLRQALKARIENLSWMTDETKQKALAKWSTFRPKIGYPDKWRDWSGLATQRNSYLENVLAAAAFNQRYELDKVGKPVDKTEWGMTPQTVNAYYDPLQNEIVFPAAILQPPMFDAQADDPINYGAIGAVIGHELTHGYDDQGSRFGPTGNFEEWWAASDAKQFKSLTRKLIKQYDGYEAAPGLKVNGNLTLGENIADLGGLNIAYDALQRATAGTPDPMTDGLSRDQRFFIGYATAWRRQLSPERLKVLVASDPHSPPQIRASGTPTNMPAFAKAFACKEGDPMVNSGDRLVTIW
jgi:putative endopeptidase